MSTVSDRKTMTLYRPVGLKEYELIREANMKAYPPRLDFQPIFYPVLNREYAAQIAREWNTKDQASDYVGIVTRFEVDAEYASQFDRKVVGSSVHEELWVPADDLEVFNEQIVGGIEVIEVFYGDEYDGPEIAVTSSQ